MKFCPNCGSPRAAKFCGNCGFAFESAEAAVAIEVRVTVPVWLPDQSDPTIERFWNGQNWTSMTKPVGPNVVWALSEAEGLAQADPAAGAQRQVPYAPGADAKLFAAAARVPNTPLVYGEGFNPATNCHNCGNPAQKAGKPCKLCGAVFNA